MLTYLKIKNYESHRESYFEFSPGVNLLIGDSDVGKTSVLRAISVPCFNDWSEDMIRNNKGVSEIELGTNRGYVNVRKGVNINEWTVFDAAEKKKYEFEKVGKTVPDKASYILGINEVEMSDIVERPNMMYQLEKHYLISEVDGKKCSANMFARVVDNVLGLGGVEELIKDISTDGISSRRKLNANIESIEKLQKNLHPQETIDKLKAKVDGAKRICDAIESMQKYSDNLAGYISRYNDTNENVRKMNDRLKYIGRKDGAKILYNEVKKMVDEYDRLFNMVDTASDLNVKLKDISGKIEKIPKTMVNTSEIRVKCELYDSLNGMYENYMKNRSHAAAIDKKLHKIILETDKLETEDKKIKAEIKICPTCKKPF